ncbi:MAG: AraC family transcriptional regulator [Streptosporangiaceae bacterium]
MSVATVAAAAGYFDRAHFSHELNALLGITPAQYGAQCAGTR